MAIARMLKLLPLLLLVGCGGSSWSQQGEVAGTVTYDGRPLPGGVITFTSAGGLQNSAVIDAQGHFQIKAAVGKAKVTVDNRVLQKKQAVRGPRLKTPPGATTAAPAVTGTYIALPKKYLSTDGSGLDCDVKAGSQTCTFKLVSGRQAKR